MFHWIHGWIYLVLLGFSLTTHAQVPFAFWKPYSAPMCTPGDLGPPINIYADSGGGIRAAATNGTTTYIGGYFLGMQNQERGGLAAFTSATGNLLPFNPRISNGEIRALLLSGSTLYVAGNFDDIGANYRTTGLPVEPFSGSSLAIVPLFNGPIYTSIPDGAGGWYVGGSFDHVNESPRSSLARINGDGTLHPFNPSASDAVHSLALDGTTLYVAGQFKKIGGGLRQYLAALDTTLNTNNLTPWKPHPDMNVNRILLSGSTLFASGGFSKVNTYHPGSGAPINMAGSVDVTFPATDEAIWAAVPDGSGGWYIGGDFSDVGGVERARLARVNSDGSLHPFNPGANGSVKSLVLSGSTLFVAGHFTRAGGQTRRRLAALDTTMDTNNATLWNPSVNYHVERLLLNGSTLYVAGNFHKFEDFSPGSFVQVSNLGQIHPGFPGTNGSVTAIEPDGSGGWFIGGTFTEIDGIPRQRLARINSNGSLHSFNAGVSHSNPAWAQVTALAKSGGTLYIGGYFESVGGESRNSLAAVDVSTGQTMSWNPNVDGQVEVLLPSGTLLYVGGWFENIGGAPRSNIAALRTSVDTNNASNWNPGANEGVHALELNGTILYAGGWFSQIGGQNRAGLADLNTTIDTNNALSLSKDFQSAVGFIKMNSGRLSVGGQFEAADGDPTRAYYSEICLPP